MRRSTTRAVRAAAALGVAAVWVIQPASFGRGRAAPAVSEGLALRGAGGNSSAGVVEGAQDALYTSPGKLAVRIQRSGDRDARALLASGEAKFAISGRPLSEEDNANLNKNNIAGVIDAPVGVGAQALLLRDPVVNAPFGGYTVVTVLNPDDPESDIVNSAYSGSFNVPNDLSARMLLGRTEDFLGVDEFLSANGRPLAPNATFYAAGRKPQGYVPYSPGAENYYLNLFLKTAAPAVWDSFSKTPAPVTETFPFLGAVFTRSGSAAVTTTVVGGSSWNGELAAGGSLGAVFLKDASAAFAAKSPVRFVGIRNGAGQYVQPTSEAISAAAAAAAAEPDGLPALTKQIPGAYPLTWINRLYAPKNGLDAATTNGIATVIRYMAGAGQSGAATYGDGVLPKALQDEAFAKADALVESNCTGAGQSVITLTGDAGPYWPAGAPQPSVPLKLCASAVASTTTTAAPPTTQVSAGVRLPVSGSSGVAAGSTRAATSTAVSTAPTTAASTVTSTTTTTVPAYVRQSMPLPMPSDGKGAFDRFATMLIGAGGYLAVLSLTRSMRGRRIRMGR